MKGTYTFCLLSLLFITSCFAQDIKQEANKDKYDKLMMNAMAFKFDGSINDYFNYKISITSEWHLVETNFYSISTLTSTDKKTRISSNCLMDFTYYFLINNVGLPGEYCVIFLVPDLLGNIKLYIPVTKNIRLGGGINTDYYLLYNNSVVYSEGLAGIKVNAKNFRFYVDYRCPINGSYLKNKNPYLNIGIGIVAFDIKNKVYN